MTTPQAPSYVRPYPEGMESPAGSPSDYSIAVGDAVRINGNHKPEVSETVTRLIQVSQQAGQWVGLHLDEYLASITTGMIQDWSVLADLDNGRAQLRNAFLFLVGYGALRADSDEGTKITTVWPTQRLMDLLERQGFRNQL